MKNVIQTITTAGFMMGTIHLNAWHCKACNEEHADAPGSYCSKTGVRYCPDCGKQHLLAHCPTLHPIALEEGPKAYEKYLQGLNCFDSHGSCVEFEWLLNILASAVNSKGGTFGIESGGLCIMDDGQPKSGPVTINGIVTSEFCQNPQFGTEALPIPAFDNFSTTVNILEYFHWLGLHGSKEAYEDAVSILSNLVRFKGGEIGIHQTRQYPFIKTPSRTRADTKDMFFLPGVVRSPRGEMKISWNKSTFSEP
ncbi:MAG: hypothetical protein LBJ78_01040 [Puniceicoccales bacterium]|nr:hypothetical protein [Puniceicoccales bacterium]